MSTTSKSGKFFESMGTKACKLLAAGVVASASLTPSFAAADNAWPTAPITFVAPFSAGGGGDTLTRLYGLQLNQILNVPIIVDNKPGAGGNIGTTFAAKAAPDGQTVVFGTMGTMGTNHFLYKRTGFSINDFEPVALFGTTGLAMVVPKDSPYKSVRDMITYGKANPGKLTCASGGNGTASHLACAMFQQQAGIEVSHIPYKASAAAIVDVLSQRISFFIDVTPVLAPQINDGALRALAVTTKKRLPAFPKVPTLAESGLPDYEMFSWDGMFAPKGTPADRLNRLHGAVQTALKNPEFNKRMTDRGIVLQTMSREDFSALVLREYARMGTVVKSLGVTVD
ncbi:Bug family tripartite tricarboxylate transporter substrate binding protein [Ottowia thiooxydans]|uniref:Bug family tripartite tricarboxylate transporter substrate binding protein n=1 Tax=Ottowia thiooxydans TaxID=219182 RepID=UPI000429D61D|nr:tripartite tricarboxylate transporter substrate binding protein [Ottowia thiooxydans]